jgi:hypothetical protein
VSFEAYIDNMEAKTGKKPEDFRKLAQTADILQPDMKASELTNWLMHEFDLGHGQAQALWGVFVSKGWVEPKNSRLKRPA